MIIFLGLSSYIGEKRGKQDDRGNMIGRRGSAEHNTRLKDIRAHARSQVFQGCSTRQAKSKF